MYTSLINNYHFCFFIEYLRGDNSLPLSVRNKLPIFESQGYNSLENLIELLGEQALECIKSYFSYKFQQSSNNICLRCCADFRKKQGGYCTLCCWDFECENFLNKDSFQKVQSKQSNYNQEWIFINLAYLEAQREEKQQTQALKCLQEEILQYENDYKIAQNTCSKAIDIFQTKQKEKKELDKTLLGLENTIKQKKSIQMQVVFRNYKPEKPILRYNVFLKDNRFLIIKAQLLQIDFAVPIKPNIILGLNKAIVGNPSIMGSALYLFPIQDAFQTLSDKTNTWQLDCLAFLKGKVKGSFYISLSHALKRYYRICLRR